MTAGNAAPRKTPAKRRIAKADPLVKADLKAGVAAARIGQKPGVKPLVQAAELADQPPLLALALGVTLIGAFKRDTRLTRSGLRMMIAGVVAVGAARIGKQVVSRSRPRSLLAKGEHTFTANGPHDHAHKSFPSAHTAGSVAMARAWARDYPGYHTPALSAALTAGALKVFKGDHFPTDVIAGFAVGVAAEALASRFAPHEKPDIQP